MSDDGYRFAYGCSFLVSSLWAIDLSGLIENCICIRIKEINLNIHLYF